MTGSTSGRLPDTRTRIVVVVISLAALLGSGSTTVSVLVTALLSLGWLASGRGRLAAITALLGAVAFVALPAVATRWATPGVATVHAMLAYTARFVLGGACGAWLIVVTSPSELVAALRQMRVPEVVVLPAAVMLRFVPVLHQDCTGIVEGLRLRGVLAGGRAWRHPVQAGTLFVIPLVAGAIQTGDDLTAAAMLRGLGPA